MSLTKKIIINTIAEIIFEMISVAAAFIVPRMIIGHYGSEYNGLVASVSQFLGYISLLDVGIAGVVRSKYYKAIEEKDIDSISQIYVTSDKMYKRIAFFFVTFVIVLSIFYPLIVDDFPYLFSVEMVWILGINTFGGYLIGAPCTLLLRADQKGYIISILNAASTIVTTISTIILIYLNASILMLKLVVAIITVVPMMCQYIIIRRKYHINHRAQGDNGIKKERWDAAVHTISNFVHSNTDIVIITLFCGVTEVSVYTVYMLVLNGIFKICQGLFSGFESAIGSIANKNSMSELKRIFSIYQTISQICSIVFYVTCGVMIIPFIKLYIGDVADVDYIRVSFAVLYVIAEFFDTVKRPYFDLIRGMGQFKETRWMAISEAGINILLSVVFVPVIGMTGVAVGTFAAMLFRAVVSIIYVNKYILKMDEKVTVDRIVTLFLGGAIAFGLASLLSCIWRQWELNYFYWIMEALLTACIAFITAFFIFQLKFKADFGFIAKRIRKRRVTK